MESPRCARRSRVAHERSPSRESVIDTPATDENLTRTYKGGQGMGTKDKNAKKSMEKKPAQKTLKEKRLAKKAKK
jgi:hypothetical protein